jgi:GAF domain-containing protein
VEDHYGCTAGEVLGAAGAAADRIMARVRDSGEAELDVVVDGLVDDAGEPRKLLAGFYPVRVGGEVAGVGVIVRDVTAQAAAEAGRELLFERVASLASVTTGLAVANGSVDAAQVVLDEGSRALGAVAALVTLRPAAGGPVQVLGSRNLPAEWADRWLEADSSPHSDVLRTGDAVWVGDEEAMVSAYPELAGALLGIGVRSVTATPLVAHGELVGVLAFGFPEEHAFDGAEQTFLAAFTGPARRPSSGPGSTTASSGPTSGSRSWPTRAARWSPRSTGRRPSTGSRPSPCPRWPTCASCSCWTTRGSPGRSR